MKAILLQDVRSFGKDKRLYGKKGEKVTIVSEHSNVLIVWLEKAENGFPVTPNEIRKL